MRGGPLDYRASQIYLHLWRLVHLHLKKQEQKSLIWSTSGLYFLGVSMGLDPEWGMMVILFSVLVNIVMWSSVIWIAFTRVLLVALYPLCCAWPESGDELHHAIFYCLWAFVPSVFRHYNIQYLLHTNLWLGLHIKGDTKYAKYTRYDNRVGIFKIVRKFCNCTFLSDVNNGVFLSNLIAKLQ